MPKRTLSNGEKVAAEIRGRFELDAHEEALLVEVVRTVDQLDVLAGIVADEGSMVDGRFGPRAHPALVEARQLRITLARLVAALRLPDEDVGARPQRRGTRGVYGIRGSVG